MDLADTGELVHGQWNSEGGNSAVLLHYFKSRITSGLIKGLAQTWQLLISEEIHTTQQGRACARPDGLGANTACEPADPKNRRGARACTAGLGEVRMDPLFNLRNETPSSRSGSAKRGGQGVGKLPGRADESAEMVGGPFEDLPRCASDNSMLIRPEIFEG